jgi:hypothetical protein
MALAIWCDLKDNGHAFDEREAVIVAWKDDVHYHCRAHCGQAFSTVFYAARSTGEARILLPDLRGVFSVCPEPDGPGPSFSSEFINGDKGSNDEREQTRQARRDDAASEGKHPGMQPPEEAGEEKPPPDEFRRYFRELWKIMEAESPRSFHPDKRLTGIAVLCCDGTAEGHAFDEREATTVTDGDKQTRFCKEHRAAGFIAAFNAASSAKGSKIYVAQLGTSFMIRPAEQLTVHNGQSGEGPGQVKKPPPSRQSGEPAENHGGRA